MTGIETERRPPPRRSRRLKYLAIGGVLAFVLVVGAAAHSGSYVARSDDFCTSCHVPEGGEASWAATHHPGVGCQSCHREDAATDAVLFFRSMAGRKGAGAPPHGTVGDDGCTDCHASLSSEWSVTASTSGHRAHAGRAEIGCATCHGGEAHGGPPAAEACTATCHESVTLHARTPKADRCVACHNFRAPAEGDLSRSAECRTCHAPATVGAATRAAGGGVAAAGARPGKAGRIPIRPVAELESVHGGNDCAGCHNPHSTTAAERERDQTCTRCHGGAVEAAVGKGPPGHYDCAGCHEPHAPALSAADSCWACHSSESVAEGGALEPKGEKPPPRFEFAGVTHSGECHRCHTPHEWVASRVDCVGCHDAVAERSLERAPEEHGDCTNCHNPHSDKGPLVSCVRCHGREAKTVATSAAARKVEEHVMCSSCHPPHAEKNSPVASCAGCHKPMAAAVAAGPAEHHRCTACHVPHDVAKKGTAVRACAGCHGPRNAEVTKAGTPEPHRACVTCHAVHPGAGAAPKAPAAACASCHLGEAAPAAEARILATGSHKGDCLACHATHGPPAVEKACASCHERIDVRPPRGAGAAAHGKCQSCHQPHTLAASAPLACASCHGREVKGAGAWRPAEHRGCPGCHEEHAVGTKPACASCHKENAAEVARGPKEHRCEGCHPIHGGPPARIPSGFWDGCARCHATEVAAVAKRGKTHSECKNCHGDHEFEAPACTSCHAKSSLSGVHTSPSHAKAKCSDCHDKHASAVPGRDRCLACHTDKMTHEPAARRCAACHPFSATLPAAAR